MPKHAMQSSSRSCISALMLSTVIPVAIAGLALSTPAIAKETRAAVTADADWLDELELDFPTTTFKLNNGLTVIVNEDHGAPLVAVNVTYRVGSRDEPEGKTGFAHLFEHLMFNGSENFNDDYFKATKQLGATGMNGTTSNDRTNYYQTVPKEAFDSILWLESDRMGHLLGAIDQAKLDEQRAVVKNEKRQSENSPTGFLRDLVIEKLYPDDHPYAHSTIGSMEDLDAASLDDVKEWFRKYYGASNAILSISGDVTVDEVRAKVEKYFGDIASGEPLVKVKVWPVPLKEDIRVEADARIANPSLQMLWNTGPSMTAEDGDLGLIAGILTEGKTSRLYRRLVDEERLALNVSAGVGPGEIAASFLLSATAVDEAALPRIEAIMNEELQQMMAEGPTAKEIKRIGVGTIVGLSQQIDRIGWKANVAAASYAATGRADGWTISTERQRKATPGELRDTARKWFTNGKLVVTILPVAEMAVNSAGADRRKMPMPGEAAPAVFPDAERATLANGMKMIVVNKPGSPSLAMSMIFRVGDAADWRETKPIDLPRATFELMNDATMRYDLQARTDALVDLGTNINTGAGGQQAWASMRVLKPALVPALDIFSEVIQHPAFKEEDVETDRKDRANIAIAARAAPRRIASELFDHVLYGEHNPDGLLADEAKFSALTRDKIVDYHKRWVTPKNATLIVVGDTSMAEMQPLVSMAFAQWAGDEAPETVVLRVPEAAQPVIYLVDEPGALQSQIYAGVMGPPTSASTEVANDLMNAVLGGTFTSRLNMKLREEKGWAYGANSTIRSPVGSQTFRLGAPVQTDKTAESMHEISVILKELTTSRPITETELDPIKHDKVLGLIDEWSSSGSIKSYHEIAELHSLPDGYFKNYADRISKTSLDEVNAAAQQIIGQKPLTWLVFGDLEKIEASIRKLGLGEVRKIDRKGNLIE